MVLHCDILCTRYHVSSLVMYNAVITPVLITGLVYGRQSMNFLVGGCVLAVE